MTSEHEAELKRLIAVLPVAGSHWQRTRLSILRARIQGLLDGVASGECWGGGWSVCDADAPTLIALATEELEKPITSELKLTLPELRIHKLHPSVHCPECRDLMRPIASDNWNDYRCECGAYVHLGENA